MLLYVGVFTTVVYRVFTQQVGAGVKPGYENHCHGSSRYTARSSSYNYHHSNLTGVVI